MFYNNMEVNCKVFSSKQDWRIRVVFGEDGAPVFCALDVAASMGFMAPQNGGCPLQGGTGGSPHPLEQHRTERVLRYAVPHGAVPDGVHQGLLHSAGTPASSSGLETVVVPGAKEFATETDVGRNSPAPSFSSVPAPASEPLKIPAGQPNIAKQIDDIIFDLMVLKKNLA